MKPPRTSGTDGPRSFARQPFRIHGLYAYLKGTWSLQREVHMAGEGRHAIFRGEAAFRDGGDDALAYLESGALETPVGEFAASRAYTFAFKGPDLAEVRFADGRFFHVLDLTEGLSQVEHVCGDDTYRGLFRTVDDDNWLSVWRVSGPRKDQVITSRYGRLPTGGSA